MEANFAICGPSEGEAHVHEHNSRLEEVNAAERRGEIVECDLDSGISQPLTARGRHKPETVLMMKQAHEQPENQETDQRRSDEVRPGALGAIQIHHARRRDLGSLNTKLQRPPSIAYWIRLNGLITAPAAQEIR